jgi:hypothetical protein
MSTALAMDFEAIGSNFLGSNFISISKQSYLNFSILISMLVKCEK